MRGCRLHCGGFRIRPWKSRWRRRHLLFRLLLQCCSAFAADRASGSGCGVGGSGSNSLKLSGRKMGFFDGRGDDGGLLLRGALLYLLHLLKLDVEVWFP